MSTVIKPRRGSGSPAGSLAQYEIAMDVDAQVLYVSSDGVDALVLAEPVIPAVENAFELDLTGSVDIESDLSIQDSPLTVRANVNNMPGNQQNGAVTAFILKETTNNTRRNRMLMGTTNAGTPTYVGGIDTRFQNDEKKLRFTAPSDDDTGNSVNMFEMKSNLTAGTVQHNITGRIVQAGVDSTQQPQNFSMEADANGSTFHEFLSSILNTGADAIPNSLTSTYTFSAENDASGGPQNIGRFSAIYNSSEDQNEIVMSALGHDGTTLSDLILTQNICEVTVPFKYQSVDLGTTTPALQEPGMMVYNTATNRPAFYNGTTWIDL